MSLRLHPAHGVNPTVVVCLFCGKDRGELALLGAAYKDKAPRKMILDAQPCENCQTQMASGVALVEAHPREEHNCVAVGPNGPWLTGRWMVIKEDALERVIPDPQMCVQIRKHMKAYIDTQTFDALVPNG